MDWSTLLAEAEIFQKRLDPTDFGKPLSFPRDAMRLTFLVFSQIFEQLILLHLFMNTKG